MEAVRRVLVIDDEEPIRQVIGGCLEELGNWQVLTAASGQEGLVIAQSEIPNGILLDVSMPEMDGVATFEQLQRLPVTQNIPVALLTAKVQPTDQRQFAQLAISGVIFKPFDPLTLVDQVAAIFGWEL